jgi:hypothetical protein
MGKVIDFKAAAEKKKNRDTDDNAFLEAGVGALVQTITERKQLIIVPCVDTRTGKKIKALCTSVEVSKGQFMILPLAQLFESNPIDFLKPTGMLTGA